MVASPEATVIDNDLCGVILWSVHGVGISDEILDLEAIHSVATGKGHYPGTAQTLARVKADYIYPHLAYRRSVVESQAAGSPSIWDEAPAIAGNPRRPTDRS